MLYFESEKRGVKSKLVFDWLINLFLGLGLIVEILIIVVAVMLIILLVKAGRIIQRTNKIMDDVDQAGRWLSRLSWSRTAGRFLRLLSGQSDDQNSDK